MIRFNKILVFGITVLSTITIANPNVIDIKSKDARSIENRRPKTPEEIGRQMDLSAIKEKVGGLILDADLRHKELLQESETADPAKKRELQYLAEYEKAFSEYLTTGYLSSRTNPAQFKKDMEAATKSFNNLRDEGLSYKKLAPGTESGDYGTVLRACQKFNGDWDMQLDLAAFQGSAKVAYSRYYAYKALYDLMKTTGAE